MPQHYLRFSDLDSDTYAYLFARSALLKARFKNYQPHHPLADRTLVMVFEKNSTRTRLSFEAAMFQLGGHAIFLSTRDSQLGRGEPVADAARVISRMSDLIMVRTFDQSIIAEFAAHSHVPVINGLTNQHHPCQVLADIFTYVEARGDIRGRTVAWVGDANNMLHSWIDAAEIFGIQLRVATPAGLPPPPPLSVTQKRYVEYSNDPEYVCRGADIVTTDVFTSMGFETDNHTAETLRKKAFSGFVVDASKMQLAQKDAVFLHCLPAHRGEEVSADVIDGPQSLVWAEAENRLHAQKALMEYLLLGRQTN